MLRAALIVVAALFALAITFRVSVTRVYQPAYPALALAWSPGDASASASMAARLLAARRAPDARQLAMAAIQRDATSVVAFRTLGLAAEGEGDAAGARRLMALANAISRRDRMTQAWLIRSALRRGDFETAFDHFDIAMRTTSRGSEPLLRLLVAATADRRVISPLGRVLSRDPEWKRPFLLMLAGSGPRADHALMLIRGRLDPANPEEEVVLRSLLHRLTNENQFDLAWEVYRAIKPDARFASLSSVRDGGFDAGSGYPPFEWTFAAEADLAAIRSARPDDGRGHVLSVVAQNGRAGAVARQLLRLGPGRYRLEFEAGELPVTPIERPGLSLTCAHASGAFFSLLPGTAGSNPRRVAGHFTVPPGCSWQWLIIQAVSGDAPVEVSPWIDNLSIRREF